MTHFKENMSHNLPRAYTQHIPADRDEIPRPELTQKWAHLKRLENQIPSYMEGVEIGLLIGPNCPSILRPREVIHGEENTPYAVRSVIGGYVNGPASQRKGKTICDATAYSLLHRTVDI